MLPPAVLCILCSLPPGLCTRVRENPLLVLGWALPSLPAKQLLEGAKPAPRQVPFVGMLVAHRPPAAH